MPECHPATRQRYIRALSEWSSLFRIRWEGQAAENVDLLGLSFQEATRVVYEYLLSGGELDEVDETRPQWKAHRHHYDVRLQMGGRYIYVETRFIEDHSNRDDPPWIWFVNLKPVDPLEDLRS